MRFRYEISVESPAERLFEAMPERLLEHIQWSRVDRAFDRMGGIFGRVSVMFIVQDQRFADRFNRGLIQEIIFGGRSSRIGHFIDADI